MTANEEGSQEDPTPAPPLFVVQGSATPEEVAALVAVLQADAAAAPAGSTTPTVRAEWSSHHRKMRASFPAGPGGWRSSALPFRPT